MPKANYPDWVMEHKKKGTYINKVGDKYYLYAAHSERIKGTTKVRRVSDGYIGRITEKEGLILARDKIKDVPYAYEIGLSFAILSTCEIIHAGLKKSYRKHADMIYACAILSTIYETYNNELFQHSYLHILFAEVVLPSTFNQTQKTGIERGRRMIKEQLLSIFNVDLPLVITFFPNVRLLIINNRYYLSSLPETVTLLSDKYNIDWRNSLWQR